MEEADLVKAVEDLQKSVTVLEERNRDLVLKAQMLSLRGTWGWDRFLSEPEFWENVYDSGLADCQGRCIRNLNEAYAACNSQHTKYSAEWNACRERALADARLCQDRCADSHQPEEP